MRSVVRGALLRALDLLLLLWRPGLLWAYLRLWALEYSRSPYGRPESFQAALALKQQAQRPDELVYGETPLVTSLWLFHKAGLKRGDRLLDIGAGRGRALLAARWLGAEAIGVELLTSSSAFRPRIPTALVEAHRLLKSLRWVPAAGESCRSLDRRFGRAPP